MIWTTKIDMHATWTLVTRDRGLRIDYCGFWPFGSTRTKLLLSFSLLKVFICIIY